MPTQDTMWMRIGRELMEEEVYIDAHRDDGESWLVEVCVDGTITLTRQEWNLLRQAREQEDT